MKTLDSKLVKYLLQRAEKSISGEWILVGGSLLPALGLDYRSTLDIDLIGLET